MISLQRLAFPLARRFVAGESVTEVLEAVRALNAAGMTATIDILGEDVHTSADADRTRDAYLGLIERLAQSGLRTNESIKLSALGLRLDRAATSARLARVLAAADTLADPFVRVDMEGSALTDATLTVVTEAFATRSNTGPVLQAALHRTPADLNRALRTGMRVRLCKGAYHEPLEVALRDARAIRVRFLALAMRLLEHGTYPAIATHDPLLIAAVQQTARERGVAADRFEFQLLYGVRPDLQRRLVAEGWRVRVYVPFGTHWARYFRRRIAERRENLLFALRAIATAGTRSAV